MYSLFPAAVYPIVRNRGHFEEVSVSWFMEPALSGDVTPLRGNITFKEGEYLKNLTVFSVPDEVKHQAELEYAPTDPNYVFSYILFLVLLF